MGTRGQIRDPLSRRGVREMPDWRPEEPQRPEAPEWLTETAVVIFTKLVDDLITAKVPLKTVDSHAIAMAATSIDEVRRWNEVGKSSPTTEMRMQCAKLVARNKADAHEWLMVLGATPTSRARMGLRGQKEEKKPGAVASILQRRSAG